MVGDGDFIGETTNLNVCNAYGTYSYNSYSTQVWNKIKCNAYYPHQAYVVGTGTQIEKVLVPGSAINPVTLPATFGPSDFNSLYVFRDNSVMTVGTQGKIYYQNSHGNWLDFSFGDSTAFTWRDVFLPILQHLY